MNIEEFVKDNIKYLGYGVTAAALYGIARHYDWNLDISGSLGSCANVADQARGALDHYKAGACLTLEPVRNVLDGAVLAAEAGVAALVVKPLVKGIIGAPKWVYKKFKP